jgi:hypothetical protein
MYKRSMSIVDVICFVINNPDKKKGLSILHDVMFEHPRLFVMGGFSMAKDKNEDGSDILMADFSLSRSILAFIPGADEPEFRRRSMRILSLYKTYAYPPSPEVEEEFQQKKKDTLNCVHDDEDDGDDDDEYYASASMYTSRSGL